MNKKANGHMDKHLPLYSKAISYDMKLSRQRAIGSIYSKTGMI